MFVMSTRLLVNVIWATCTVGKQISGDFQHAFQSEFKARGSVNRPRMLVSRGCSGSSAISVFTRSLLQNHGIPVPTGSNGRVINGKPAPPNGLGWPAELLSRKTNWFLEKADNDLGKAMELAAVEMTRTNQTLFFKGMIKSLQGTGYRGDEWASLKSTLKKLNVFAVIGTRANMLDEIVCQVRDCFQPRYGSPVDRHGQETNLCFKRRGAPTNPTSKEKLTEKDETSVSTVYKAKLEANLLVRHIEIELKVVDIARKNLESAGIFPKTVFAEDLLGFQTPVPTAFKRAVAAWSVLLQSLGVSPDEEIVESFLWRYRNTYPEPPDHVDVIYNFAEVRAELNQTDYAHFIRGH
eukprot:TRINITY_DN43_c0_g1_i3.p1 TRINITY_DN43_c0_g1~~TRINITY_DN43_c0_g1_i3.p1  ORF type:complete len:351 (-),score=44.81 TRINITY_DN43_c0_g1_i3:24-1076(-)